MRLPLKILFSFLLFLSIWFGGLIWFNLQVSRPVSNSIEKTDAIVVLTGGSGRLERGFALLAKGKGGHLFISGAGKGVTLRDLRRQLPDWLQHSDALPVTLGSEAVNTIGNAEETRRWMKNHGYKTLRLVTTDYHMPRAIREFKAVIPDVPIVPEPVADPSLGAGPLWKTQEGRAMLLSEYHKFLASKLRHWMVSATQD